MTDPVIDKVAWIHLEGACILSTRSRGKDKYYLPGGKREPGESDAQCLRREISEELAVTLKPETLRPIGVFEAQAHDDTPPAWAEATSRFFLGFDSEGNVFGTSWEGR